jgi:hypothetical protein
MYLSELVVANLCIYLGLISQVHQARKSQLLVHDA